MPATGSADSQFFEDEFEGTEVGKRGLKQIKTHESGKPKPVWVVVMCQDKTGENERTSESADNELEFHKEVGRFVIGWSKDLVIVDYMSI